MSSLRKFSGLIDKALQDLEIQVQCTHSLGEVVGIVQNSDPGLVASEICDKIIGQVPSLSRIPQSF